MGPGERHTYYQDAAGEMLLISDALLRERSGELKADKRGRGKYLLLYADTIKQPQEIWDDWANSETARCCVAAMWPTGRWKGSPCRR